MHNERLRIMLSAEEQLKALAKLGLSKLQARLYLILINIGRSTTKEIVKASDIARQEVNRVTNELLQKGLIKKIIAVPVEYEATPLTEAIDYLLRQRRQETAKLEKETTIILKSHRSQTMNNKLISENNFVLVPASTSLSTYLRLLENTRKSYYGIFFSEGINALSHVLEDPYTKFLAEGGEIKIITSKTKGSDSLQKIRLTFMNKGSFEVRYTTKRLFATTSIFDQKEILFTTTDTVRPDKTMSLYSNNQNLVRFVAKYFEQVWDESQPFVSEKSIHQWVERKVSQ